MNSTAITSDLDRALELLGALAVETRLKLLLRLADGERCVCELTPGVGEQSNVSRHLARLKELGVVACRIDGPRRMYRITDPAVPALLRALGLATAPALDSDGDFQL